MSRVGNLPIPIPPKVKVALSDRLLTIKGPNGNLTFELPGPIMVSIDNDNVVVTRANDDRESRSLHGLSRREIANCIKGVNEGFSKELEINGVGYRAELKGKNLELSLGYSHPVNFALPEGVTAAVDAKKTKLTLSSNNKQLLGNTAAKVRSFRPPEPYKGKGIRYSDEVVRRKEGKSAGK